MNKTIYTFWEGKMPEYLKLCMETWKFPFILLTYDNINQYTEKIPEKLKQLTLPKQADYIRVHVLRDNGGIWLDTDTIMLNDELPSECILGDDVTRANTIGFLQTEPQSDFFETWAEFQDWKLNKLPNMKKDTSAWNVMGNAFTDYWLKVHKDIKIGKLMQNWPETYMIKGNVGRNVKYCKFYFESNFSLDDVKDKTNMLMLHNSWTPDWYKTLSKEKVLNQKGTLSNILNVFNQK